MTKDIGDMSADDWRGLGNFTFNLNREQVVARLEAAERQRDELAKVCEKAMEWAAGYPLGRCFSTADGMAAQDVYDACDAALAAVKAG